MLLKKFTLFNHVKHDPSPQITPRTVIFGGKAAPSYFMAKLIIKLINSVAGCIDSDPVVRDRVELPDAKQFLQFRDERVFQQPPLLSTVI